MQKRIESAAKKYEKTLDQLKADERAYAQSLLDAYQEGLTWDEVARIAGLTSGNQARLRAMRAREEDSDRPVGITVEEAAKKLRITKVTVYKRIDRGELKAVTDAYGRTRVVLE